MGKPKFVKPRDRQAWLRMRVAVITSTEMAGLLRLSEYTCPWELYHQKKNREIDDVDENERMKWGRRLESAIADGIEDDLGLMMRPLKEFGYHAEFPRMAASFDYEITGVTEETPDEIRELFETLGNGLVEIKNVDWLQYRDTWLEDEDDFIEAPARIEVQVQHQMEVSRHEWAIIVPFIGGSDPKIIIRRRNIKVGAILLSKAKEFWKMVDNEQEPEPHFEMDSAYIIERYQSAGGGEVLMTANRKLEDLMLKYKGSASTESAARTEKAAHKAAILMLIGDAPKVITDIGTITAREVEETKIEVDSREGYRSFSVNINKAAEEN